MNFFKQISAFGFTVILLSACGSMHKRSTKKTLVMSQDTLSSKEISTQNMITMTKKWEKVAKNNYAFFKDDNKIGEIKLKPNTLQSQAICQIEGEEFIIKRTGFWKTTIEIFNAEREAVAKTYNEKWFANSSIFEYGEKKYKLMLHNNPNAEWVIKDGENTLLAYGLQKDKNQPCVKITGDVAQDNVLFDFLLWYLFLPIANQNMGDDMMFLLLVSAQ